MLRWFRERDARYHRYMSLRSITLRVGVEDCWFSDFSSS